MARPTLHLLQAHKLFPDTLQDHEHNAKIMHNLLFDKFLKPYQINMKGKHQVQKYGEDYSGSDVNKSFLPAILFTSGHIHGEFMRLINVLTHRQTITFFETFEEEPPNEACTWRRAEYFFHTRAANGLSCGELKRLRMT